MRSSPAYSPLETALVTSIEDRSRLDRFAEAAAEHFRAHAESWTFAEAEIDPLLLAIRWGSDNTSVLVAQLDEFFRPLIYSDLLPQMKRERGRTDLLWSFEMIEASFGSSPAQLADELDDLLRRVLRVFFRMAGVDEGPSRVLVEEVGTTAASSVRRVLGVDPVAEPAEPPSWMPRPRIFDLAGGGALVCREPIPGVTHEMTGDEVLYYTERGLGRHFVAESMNRSTARAIASSLGGVLADEIVEIARRAGVGLLSLPPASAPAARGEEIPSYLDRHPELVEDLRAAGGDVEDLVREPSGGPL